jgi:hypothetical protein
MSDHPQGNPDGGKHDTTDYSASKAPETRGAVESKEGSGDPRTVPGGALGASADVGMSGMDRADTPSQGVVPGAPAERSE